MPVITISYEKDPRRLAQSPSTLPYTFDARSFPAIPSFEQRVTDGQAIQASVTRTWAGIVRYGPLKADLKDDISVDQGALEDEGLTSLTLVAPAPDPTFHNFLDLPRELRLVIWDLAIRGRPYRSPGGCNLRYLCDNINVREYVKAKNDPFQPRFLPAICFASKQTMEETTAVVIEGSRFMVASLHDNTFLRTFLKAAPGRLELCRHLDFDYFSRFPEGFEANADLELAAQCSGLQTIKLTFHYQPLTYKVALYEYEGGLTSFPHHADYLFEKFRFKRLLDCDMLKTIIVEHTGYYIDAAVEAAEGLGQLLEREFAQKVPKQNVTVQYTRKVRLHRNRYMY